MGNQGEIRSEMNNLTEVILHSKKTFHIPDFQRDFVWTSEEAEDLFQDFVEDTNNFELETSMLQGYLLGNVVLIDGGDKWLVVDGQQRLTTLTLMFKALFEVVQEKAYDTSSSDYMIWSRRLGDLEKGFNFLDDAGQFKGLKITHESTLPFGEYYKAIIRDIQGVEPQVQSDENIEEVYNTVLEKIKELAPNQLVCFIAYLRTTVKLIVTTAPSQAKAFQLFEVLNDRGRSLEPLDLVKNSLLKQLSLSSYQSTDIEDFNKNWSEFVNNLQITNKRKINSSTFMKHFIIAEFGENVKQDRLFEFFTKGNGKIPIRQPQEILALSRKLNQVSQFYKEIEKQPTNNSYSDHQNMFILFKILRLKQLHPLLMKFYDSTKDTKDRVLDAAVRYGASILFSYTQANMIERELPILIKETLDHKLEGHELEEFVIQKLNTLINKRRKTIEQIIPTKDFADARGSAQKKAVDMLKFIELYFNDNTSIITVPRNKKMSVEHILARSLKVNLKEYGFENKDEYIEYLNRIGNLTLLYNVENSSLGNAIFVDKIHAYKKTDFIITRTIVEKEKTVVKNGKTTFNVNLLNKYQPNYITKESKIWNKEMIDQRGENIAKLVSYLVSNKREKNTK